MTQALGLPQVSARKFLGTESGDRNLLDSGGLLSGGEEAVRMERPNHLLSAVGF